MGPDAGQNAAAVAAARDAAGKSTGDLRLLYMVPYLAGGGTERHVLDLIQTIRWSQPPWIIAPDGPSRPSVQAAGARWLEVPVLSLERRSVAAWREACAQAIAEFDPHIVHVHAGVELLWVTRRLAPERPRVFTVHGYHGRGADLSYWLAGVLGRRLAQRVIAVSESEGRRLSAVPRSRLRVVLNGVSDRRLAESPPLVPGLPESAAVVAVASRLEPAKGVDVVVEAFIQLLRRDRPALSFGSQAEAHLVVLGTGSQEEALRQRVVEAGVEDRIHVVGYEPRAAAFFRRADVVVQVSRQDALPLTIAEAMAAGVPAVVSDAGGLPELVQDGVTGLIVPAGETDALEQALAAQLLTDPERRIQMGKAARRRYEEYFTVERFAEATLQVYRELLDRT